MCRCAVLLAVAVAAFSLLAGPSGATTVYTCAVKPQGSRHMPPPFVIIAHDEATGTVLIGDSLTLQFNDGLPAHGHVTAENAKRITFSWSLGDGVETTRNQYVSDFRFRATYLKSSGRVSVYAKPLGYASQFTGYGACNTTQK